MTKRVDTRRPTYTEDGTVLVKSSTGRVVSGRTIQEAAREIERLGEAA